MEAESAHILLEFIWVESRTTVGLALRAIHYGSFAFHIDAMIS